jgi:hypothetical protein
MNAESQALAPSVSFVGQAVPDELRIQTVRAGFRQAQPDLLSIGVLLEFNGKPASASHNSWRSGNAVAFGLPLNDSVAA